jgi:1,4-dihydroxy-2-naphthoyl-CoA hydrolase
MTPEELVSSMPYAKALGMRVTGAEPGEVRGQLDWDADLCTIGGVLHGGALMTFADSMGAICAFLNLPPGAGTSTIESKTNMFRAVRSGRVDATSTPLHVGRTTIVVQTDLRGAEGKRVALVTQTQAVLLPAS